MSYIGNNLQVAYPSYLIIDDISSQFNGVLKTFALRVAGSTPVPFPINPQQCLISVNNIVQKPDSTGVSGFTLTGSNIVFATAPTAGWSFFGTILAGADYVNVGANFPSGTAAIPSVTFDQSTGTGLFLASSNVLGITTGGVQRLVVNSSGFVGIGTSSPSSFLHLAAASGTVQMQFNSGGTSSYIGHDSAFTGFDIAAGGGIKFRYFNGASFAEAMRITSAGLVGIGTSSPGSALDVAGEIRIYPASGDANLRFGSGGVEKGRIAVNSSSNCIIETAGSERLRITSAGLVGIGTSSPGKTLDVTGTARVSSVLTMGSYIQGTTQLDLYGDSSSSSGVRLDSSGRLGIGTTSPGQSLSIVSPSTAQAIGIWNRASDNIYSGIYFKTSDGATDQSSILNERAGTNGASLLFYTKADGGSTTERVRIDSSGNVGIGTSSPGAKLEVRGSLSVGENYIDTLNTDHSITLRNTGAVNNNNYTARIQSAAGGPQPSDSSLVCLTQTWNGSAYVLTEKMRVDSAGNVGIGTSSPSSFLHLAAASGTVQMQFNSGGTSSYIGHDSGFTGLDITAGGGIRFRYYTGTVFAEAARIDSSGRLLVGTSTARSNFFDGASSAALQLEGNSTGTASLSITRNDATADGNALILAKARSTAYAVLQYVNGTTSDDRIGRISFQGADGTNMVPAANIEAFVDGTPGANDMPGRLVFSTTADGAASPTEAMRINNQRELLIGTTTRTANGGVLQVSNGITFPATAVACTDANTLDNYEEGTWTPTDDSGAGLSFTVSNCRYTKIGRAVAIQGTITYPSTANTNNAAFTSFPFAAADNITLSVIYTDASVANFTYLSSNTATCFLLTPGLNVINATMSGKSFTFAGVYAI